MSILFKNYSLAEVIYLLITCNKTKSLKIQGNRKYYKQQRNFKL